MAKRKGPATNEPQEKTGDLAKEYSDIVSLATDLVSKVAPHWELEPLRKTLQQIIFMAKPEQAAPLCRYSVWTFIPGGGVIQLHFPGEGHVLIDPASDCSPALFELGRVLRFVLGEKVQVGRPGENA